MNRPAFTTRILRRLILPVIGLAVPAASLAGTDAARSATTDQEMNARTAQLWQSLDINRDGAISRAEFNAQHGDEFVARMPGQAGSLQATMRASTLIGKEVRNRRGDDVGEVEDLLVDVDNGRIRGAIVSMGGVIDLGDKLYEYPLSAFQASAGGDKLVLNVDDQAMRSARGFDRDNWPYAASTVGDASRARPTEDLWRASRLIGRDIADRNGDHLGEIEDLVVDTRNQRLQSAVLRYDRPWSLDNPLVSVPLASLKFGEERENISMDVDRHRLDDRLAQADAGNAPVHANVVVERWIVFLPTDLDSGDVNANANRGRSQATGSTSSAAAADRSSMAAPTAITVQFDRLDSNRDGQLSRAEVDAASSSAVANFDAADRNDNQSVSREEFADQARTSSLSQ